MRTTQTTQPTFVLAQIDMRTIYEPLINEGLLVPQIVVVTDNGGEDLTCYTMSSGNLYYQVQNDDLGIMLPLIITALKSKNINTHKAPEYIRHDLSVEETTRWIHVACIVSKCLDVTMPQIVFTNATENAYSYYEAGIIFLPDIEFSYNNHNNAEMLLSIAHELRHIWQYENIKICQSVPITDMKSYLLNEDELDAEAFARLFVQKSTGLFYTHEDDNITKKLIERARAISIDLDADDENWLQKSFGSI